jgi:hypothetical protein
VVHDEDPVDEEASDSSDVRREKKVLERPIAFCIIIMLVVSPDVVVPVFFIAAVPKLKPLSTRPWRLDETAPL